MAEVKVRTPPGKGGRARPASRRVGSGGGARSAPRPRRNPVITIQEPGHGGGVAEPEAPDGVAEPELVDAATEPEDTGAERPLCGVGFCPICMAVTALGDARPELTEHLTRAGLEVLMALRALIDARLSASKPRPRMQHLTIG